MRLERDFQPTIIRDIQEMLPGCHVLKLSTDFQQGMPDLLILWRDRWAILEVKRKRPTRESDWEPNQEWFLEEFNRMSFAACIYPENKEDVLDALQQTFRSRRKARVPQRQ